MGANGLASSGRSANANLNRRAPERMVGHLRRQAKNNRGSGRPDQRSGAQGAIKFFSRPICPVMPVEADPAPAIQTLHLHWRPISDPLIP